MSTTVPAKIVLKSTTKVTLSERFTQIQKMRPPPPSTQEVRVQMASQAHATQQNRRLAQQMANRPAVQAALGSRQQLAQLPQQNKFQKKSLKQRLGPSNVKARLSLNNPQRGAPAQRRGGRGGRVMNGFNNRGGQVRGGRGGRGNRGAGRGQQRWRDQDDYHPRGRGGFGRPGNQYVWREQVDYHPRGRGGFGRPGNQYVGRGGGGGRGRGNSPGFRGQRGGRGGPRGRGGRGGRGRGGENFTREQLDNQLEEYMSKTKYSLNAELDEYMSNADN